MHYVPFDKLVDFGTAFLVKKGVPEDNARYVAETAVKTQAFGVATHGLVLFSNMNKALGTEIDPKAEPVVVRETSAMAMIDGKSCIGPLAVRLAVDLGRTKARDLGVGMIGLSNASWIGALGVYIAPLAEEGLMAEMWAQTSTCRDCAPWGGIDARFSTNPVAFAFPTGGTPMVADFSTAAMSMGKAYGLIREGRKAGERLFMDKDGNATDDPSVLEEKGTLFHFGGEREGYRGYAMSLWCEALTALAGGHCNNPENPSRQSFNLTVVDPEVFVGREAYLAEMQRFVAHLKSSRLRPGFDEIRLPGERNYRCIEEAKTKGVPVENSRAEQLDRFAAEQGLGSVFNA